MPRMQLSITLTVGDQMHQAATEADATLLLASSGPLSIESALLTPTDELRRGLAMEVHESRDEGRVNRYALGPK